MAQASYLQRKALLIAMLALTGTLAGFVLSSGVTGENLSGSTGSPQLISVEPLPAMDGVMCEWMPASASTTLLASMRQQRLSAGSGAGAAGQNSGEETAPRAPLRVIRDPYSSYSAVAVDPVRGEVVMTDESFFNILVYDRLDNTPPNAAMTEPEAQDRGRAHENRISVRPVY